MTTIIDNDEIISITVAGTGVAGPPGPPGSGGGGGGSFPKYTGNGSPEGVKVAVLGESYQDTTNGGIYFKAGVDGENTGWWAGVANDAQAIYGNEVGGFYVGAGQPLMLAAQGRQGVISDVLAWNGTGNGIYWFNTNIDGHQGVAFNLGSSDQYQHVWSADGVYHAPGEIDLHDPANSGGSGAAILDDYLDGGNGILGLYSLPLDAPVNPAGLAIYDQFLARDATLISPATNAKVAFLTPSVLQLFNWATQASASLYLSGSDNVADASHYGSLVLEEDIGGDATSIAMQVIQGGITPKIFSVDYQGTTKIQNPLNTGGGAAIVDDYNWWDYGVLGMYPTPIGAATANYAGLTFHDRFLDPSGARIGGATDSAWSIITPGFVSFYDNGQFHGQAELSLQFNGTENAGALGTRGYLALIADVEEAGNIAINVTVHDAASGFDSFVVDYDGTTKIQNPANTGGGFAIVDDYHNDGSGTMGIYPTPLGAASNGGSIGVYDANVQPDGSFAGGATHGIANYLYGGEGGFQAYDWGSFTGLARLSVSAFDGALQSAAGVRGFLALVADSDPGPDWAAISVGLHGGSSSYVVNYDGTTLVQNPLNTGGGFAIVDDYHNLGSGAAGIYPTPIGAATQAATLTVYDQYLNVDGSQVGGSTNAAQAEISSGGMGVYMYETAALASLEVLGTPGVDDGSHYGQVVARADGGFANASALGLLVEINNTPVFSVNYLGQVIMKSLPSADPHVVGQLYTNAGALMVSAG